MRITAPDTRPVLVVGATGAVGREVTAALVAADVPIRVFVRDATRVAHLPSSVERHVGDLRRPADVRTALRGIRAAFYVSPHEADEVELATGFIRACEQARVQIVFAGVHVAESSVVRRAGLKLLFATVMRHYRGKIELAEAIARSDTRPVVLAVSNYMQNDDVFRDDILAGDFPQPIASVNRVDLRDVADIAVRALRGDIAPGEYPVVGPASLSATQCAAEWQRALGRPVRATGRDATAWTATLERRLSGRKRHDWAATFRVLGRVPVATSAKDVATATTLLGRAPRSYATYVADTAAAWKASTAPRRW